MMISKPKLFLLEAITGFTVGLILAFGLFASKPTIIPESNAVVAIVEENALYKNNHWDVEKYLGQKVTRTSHVNSTFPTTASVPVTKALPLNATFPVHAPIPVNVALPLNIKLPVKAMLKEDTKCKNERVEVIEDISKVLNITSNKVVPSLKEDWGNVTCPIKKFSKDNQSLFDYISVVTKPCRKKVMIGGRLLDYFDGEKWACLDKAFKFTKGHCTALSFGIASDWSFDDAMDVIYGCKVYSFDPTIHRADYNRTKNIRFFKMGISDRPGKLKGGKLQRYSIILDMLNLTNTVIDYLKMDVEGAEFKFLKDVLTKTPNLLKNVRQMGMEIHLPGNHKEAWRSFQHLDCLGFRIMFVNFNPVAQIQIVNGKRRGPLYEVVWAQDRRW